MLLRSSCSGLLLSKDDDDDDDDDCNRVVVCQLLQRLLLPMHINDGDDGWIRRIAVLVV